MQDSDSARGVKQSLWFKAEQEIADILIDKLEHENITPERAAQIARFIVKSIPSHVISDEQMLAIIPKLDDEFTELASVVMKHLDDYEKTNKKIIVNEVEQLINKGLLKEASGLMEKYFHKKL